MNKFWEWYLKPITDCFTESYKEPDIISQPDISFQEAKKTFIFRPQSFREYVGQEKAKKTLMSYVAGIKNRNLVFPHTIIHGNAGCGKTTLARLLAKELNVPIIEIIGSEVKNSFDILFKIQTLKTNGLLFIDEIHSLERNTVEGVYSIMEDFTYNNRPIMPFTLIGATTELGEVIKDRKPFVERFKLWIELESYKEKDIETIVRQYNAHVFPKDVLEESVYKIIGQNARATPRAGIRLLESTIYLNGDVKQALSNLNILTHGFTARDLKCLKYLNSNSKGVGLQGLCSYLNLNIELYLYEVEPYLLQHNLLVRTPRGRKITSEGIAKIKALENNNII